MANTILTPDIIAREALMVLRNNAVMAKLVHRDYSDEFVAGKGDTISVRKPATFVANEFADSIELQDAKETSVPVKMDKLLDVSFAVTSKEMALSIEDFSAQFLVPAMQAFADKVDKYLIGLEAQATHRHPHADGAISQIDVIAARKLLSDNAAPLADEIKVNKPVSIAVQELYESKIKVRQGQPIVEREKGELAEVIFDCMAEEAAAAGEDEE